MRSEMPAAAASPLQFRYRKVVDSGLQFVIVELFPDGHTEFWSQEVGEVRWFAFSPTQRERAAALSLLTDSRAVEGWPLLPATACG